MEQPNWGSSLNPSFSSFLIWKKSKISTKFPPTKYLPNPSSWFHHHYQNPRPGPGKVETTGISWFPSIYPGSFPSNSFFMSAEWAFWNAPCYSIEYKLLKAFYYSWNNSQNCQQNWQHHQGLWSFYLTSSWSCQRFSSVSPQMQTTLYPLPLQHCCSPSLPLNPISPCLSPSHLSSLKQLML